MKCLVKQAKKARIYVGGEGSSWNSPASAVKKRVNGARSKPIIEALIIDRRGKKSEGGVAPLLRPFSPLINFWWGKPTRF